MSASVRILVVDDDVELAKLIKDYLSQYGYIVYTEARGDTGMMRIVKDYPDLVILDLMLPGKDGLDVCRYVRKAYSGPILMLTAREEYMDQIVGLEIGADDYVKKPIEPRVLLARIRALLRRYEDLPTNRRLESNEQQQQQDELVFGALVIHRGSQCVLLSGQPVTLTTSEFSLLWFLASNGDRTMDREAIFKATRGISYDGVDRSIDVTVSRLRKKLGDNPLKPWRIKTVWAKGYIFVRDAWACEYCDGKL